jgi:HEAT repeat protein
VYPSMLAIGLIFLASQPVPARRQAEEPYNAVIKSAQGLSSIDLPDKRKASAVLLEQYANGLRTTALTLGGRLSADADPEVRAAAAAALARLSPIVRDYVLPALVKGLNDGNEVVRLETANAIGEIGYYAKAGVPPSP